MLGKLALLSGVTAGRRQLPAARARCRRRPDRTGAAAAASPRPRTLSLVRMFDTCTLAVFAEMKQLGGDLRIRPPGGDIAQHLEFPGGEAAIAAVAGLAPAVVAGPAGKGDP